MATIDNPCPRCDAPGGEPCRTMKGDPLPAPHVARSAPFLCMSRCDNPDEAPDPSRPRAFCLEPEGHYAPGVSPHAGPTLKGGGHTHHAVWTDNPAEPAIITVRTP